MLKVVPMVLAIALCFSNFGFINLGGIASTSEDIAITADDRIPRNHLTQEKNARFNPKRKRAENFRSCG